MDALPNQSEFIPFYKIEGAGNDFLVVLTEDLNCGESEKPAFVRNIASRNLGVGCDQFLEVTQMSPLAIQIWNSDGSKAEMCANGSRAFSLLAHTNNWIPKDATSFPLIVSERTFSMELCKNPSHGFAINLGKPTYGVREILPLANGIPFHIVHAPNPHAVVFIGGSDGWIPPEGVDKFDFRVWGPQIERHPRFPERTNVEFIFSTVGKNEISAIAKVWERGAGATLSSGSGSVAVATTLWNTQVPQAFPITVQMNSYQLLVRKNEHGQTLVSGPARIVAKGHYFTA